MTAINISVTRDIELKSWQIENAPELFALCNKNRDYLSPWLPWVPSVKTVADSGKFIADSLVEAEKKDGLELGIWQKNKLVGCLGLHSLSLTNRRAEIGYWLDSDHQGQGIMTQSVKALINYCFTKLNLNRLTIEAATENKPSNSIVQKLGFTQEGIIRQFEFVNGQFLDYKLYSLLRSEWRY